MKLKDLKEVLRSEGAWALQSAVVWNVNTCEAEVEGCSVEFAVCRYGDWDVVRIGAVDDRIVLSLRW